MTSHRTDSADHTLIDEFKSGSMDAMAKIVSRYENALFNFAMKMCRHKQDAEDVAQDTFLNAIKGLGNFKEKAKLKNWLFRIASNACARKRRKRKYEPDKELSIESFSSPESGGEKYEIPDYNTPGKNLLGQEIKDILDKAIGSLPEKYRIVLILRDIEGFSTEETADVIGKSTQLVKTRLHRARLYLRKYISEYFKEGKD